MASAMAKWANAAGQKSIFSARPARGDIGILVSAEAQAIDYLFNHRHVPETYGHAMWGAYRGFFDNGIQADWVHFDDIDGYDTLYFPYPIMLTGEHAGRLAVWVEKGGTLISEGCVAYFGDHGHVGTVQPNFGLDAVFGARETEVEFMPDIGDRIRFTFDGKPVSGGGFLQAYELKGGTQRGRYDDGRLAVAEHRHGKGRTLLVGSHPSIGHFRESERKSGNDNRGYFADVFAWTGKAQHVRLTNPDLQARLHQGADGSVLWIINQTRSVQKATVAFGSQHGAMRLGSVAWGDTSAVAGDQITIPARDVLVVRLKN
jgi:beta-galactosidase